MISRIALVFSLLLIFSVSLLAQPRSNRPVIRVILKCRIYAPMNAAIALDTKTDSSTAKTISTAINRVISPPAMIINAPTITTINEWAP